MCSIFQFLQLQQINLWRSSPKMFMVWVKFAFGCQAWRYMIALPGSSGCESVTRLRWAKQTRISHEIEIFRNNLNCVFFFGHEVADLSFRLFRDWAPTPMHFQIRLLNLLVQIKSLKGIGVYVSFTSILLDIFLKLYSGHCVVMTSGTFAVKRCIKAASNAQYFIYFVVNTLLVVIQKRRSSTDKSETIATKSKTTNIEQSYN